MKFQLDSARGWWLFLRDIILFFLGVIVWVNELLLTAEPARWEALLAGAAAMSLPFALRQDEQKP